MHNISTCNYTLANAKKKSQNVFLKKHKTKLKSTESSKSHFEICEADLNTTVALQLEPPGKFTGKK